MKIKGILLAFSAFLLTFQLQAQCGSQAKAAQTSWEHGKDIVEIAAGDENFSTLVTAVKAAGLVETLQSDGPFTVFAPTNAAFAKLPDGTVSSLLQPENKRLLTKVLTYHVVKGEFKATDVVNAIRQSGGTFTVTTVSGDI